MKLNNKNYIFELELTAEQATDLYFLNVAPPAYKDSEESNKNFLEFLIDTLLRILILIRQILL